jgi:hypothetical protein
MQIRSGLLRKVIAASNAPSAGAERAPSAPGRGRQARASNKAALKVSSLEDGPPYDGLVLHAGADASFVRAKLLPRLRGAGLRVVTAADLVEPGMVRIVGLERALQRARRTIVVVSHAYLRSETSNDRFEDHMALQRRDADIRGGRFSLVPAYLDDPDSLPHRPGWLAGLVGVRLTSAGSGNDNEDEMNRLVCTLARP